MLRLGAAFVAAVLLAAQAPPNPVPRPSEQQSQPNPAASNSDTSRYERGSEAMPVFTQVLPTAKTEIEAKEEAERRNEQASKDWWTMFFVGLTALFTLAGTIIAGIQAGFFRTQLDMMRQGVADATTAANAAAAEAELARKQYVASNRPKLRVRKVSIETPVVGQPFVVQYEVVNIGGTKATIVSNDVVFRISRTSHYDPEEMTWDSQIPIASELLQGESSIAKGEIGFFADSSEFSSYFDGWWGGRVYVIGVIKYRDDNDVLRRTAFYRVATDDPNRFEVANLSTSALADHEYED